MAALKCCVGKCQGCKNKCEVSGRCFLMKWEWFSLLALTNQLLSCIKPLGNSFEIIDNVLFKITLYLFGITEKLFVMWILSLCSCFHIVPLEEQGKVFVGAKVYMLMAKKLWTVW